MKRLDIFTINQGYNSDVLLNASGHYINNKFDLHASAGTNVLGYGNKFITDRIKLHLDNANTSFWRLKHKVWNDLEESIDAITDSRYSSFISALSGSDAVDNAIKIMWNYWAEQGQKRNVILVRKNSYHSGSITGWQMVHGQPFSKDWPSVTFVEFFDDLELTVNQIGADNIAGVLVDTVPWGKGLSDNPADWWNSLQTTITKHNLLLCVDEVLTGIGRMGCWVHSHSLGLKPNIIVLGKALTSGHDNLCLTVLDSKITEVVSNSWLAIGNTRSTNTIGAVAAVATIDFINNNNLLSYIDNTVIPYVKSLETIFLDKGITATAKGSMIQAYPNDFTNFQQTLNDSGLYHNWDKFWHLCFYDISQEEMTFIKDTLSKILK